MPDRKGKLSPTSNSAETFPAGATPGPEILFAKAALNGLQATGLAAINITKGTVPALTGLLSPRFWKGSRG